MIAFVFPGQGSQQVGMGAPWVDHPSWELVAEASAIAGRDVAHLLLHADADELRQTRSSQLATFVASLVVLDAVERMGLVPAVAAGHSLGEYTALTATGALSLDDGVRVVVARGEAMQRASEDNPGTMAAVIGLDDDDVDAACRRADGDVWVANFNAPGQVVVAGSPEGVAAATAAARDLGAKKVLPLAVGGAFHTPFMASARDSLRKALAASMLLAPDVPVVSNVDGRPHTRSSEWSTLLSAQLCSPVRWQQGVRRMIDDGVRNFVELGPGKVLTGMVKRIDRSVSCVPVSTPDDLDGLFELLAGDAAEVIHGHESAEVPDGEHLHMTERMVVSPGAGVFEPVPGWSDHAGLRVEVGALLGHVNGREVRSRFEGTLMALIALPGERVTASQPIAWLRTTQQ